MKIAFVAALAWWLASGLRNPFSAAQYHQPEASTPPRPTN